MTAQINPSPVMVNEFKTRLEQLERQADALRSGLDDIALLFTWTMERAIPADVLYRVAITDEQIAAHRDWDDQLVPVELARLFLQAHTVATRLKNLAPRDEKDAAIAAVVQAFQRVAQERQWQVPVTMEVTIGD